MNPMRTRIFIFLFFISGIGIVLGWSNLTLTHYPRGCAYTDYNPCPPTFEFHLRISKEIVCGNSGYAKMNHPSAVSECQATGTHLLRITAADAAFAARTLRKYKLQEVWLQNIHLKNGKPYWQDGTRAKGSPQPRGMCHKLDTRTGRIMNEPICSKGLGYVCFKEGISEKASRPHMQITPTKPPNWVSIGKSYSATCYGFVGPGQLYFSHFLEKKPRNVSYEDGTSLSVRDGYRRNAKGICRKFQEVIATLRLDAEDGDYAKVFCFVGQRNLRPTSGRIEQLWGSGCKLCAEGTVQYQYLLKKPTIVVTFHEQPNVLHLHRNANIICAACVGSHGNVSLSLLDPGKNNEQAIPNDLQTQNYFTMQQPCGKFVILEVALVVTASLSGKQLLCKNFRHPNAASLKRLETKEVTSRPIETQYGPQKPSITVDYFGGDPNLLTIHMRLQANCTACVGNIGSISWSVVGFGGQPLDEEELSHLYVKNIDTEVYNTSSCDRVERSTLTLIVETNLHEARLQCSSYDKEYLPGVDLEVRSKIFYVDGVENHTDSDDDVDDDDDDGDDGILDVTWIWGMLPMAVPLLLIILLLIVVGMVYVKRQRSRAQPLTRPPPMGNNTKPSPQVTDTWASDLLGGVDVQGELPTEEDLAARLDISVKEARRRLWLAIEFREQAEKARSRQQSLARRSTLHAAHTPQTENWLRTIKGKTERISTITEALKSEASGGKVSQATDASGGKEKVKRIFSKESWLSKR